MSFGGKYPNNPILLLTAPLYMSTVLRTARPTARNQSGQRLNRFVFTLNNYTDEEVEDLKSLNVKYIMFGRETCPTTNVPHLQGFVILGRQMGFGAIKKLPGLERAHIEPMRGTPQQSVAYCSKEDKNPYSCGIAPAPGKRTDLAHTIELINEGATLGEICQSRDLTAQSCAVKYSRGLMFLHSMQKMPKREPPVVIWIAGPTGIGKTRAAEEYCHSVCEDYWMSNGELRWFDGYMGQAAVLFDDYRTSHTKFAMLLRLLDRYKMMVEIKGGYVQWHPNHIIVTAPKTPREMWNLRTEEDIAQLERRVTHVLECNSYEQITEALQEITARREELEEEKEKDKDV